MPSPSAFRFIAAPFTPKTGDGTVHYDVIPAMADFLAARGVAGVFVNGTTGEGMSLTIDERQRLLIAWKKASQDKLDLIVHVGHTSTGEAQALAHHAESLQVKAIAAIGPCFFSVSDPSLLAEYCRGIAAAAPSTPFYYYHMPSMARVTCLASEALVLMQKIIPTFAGIKFTHDDLEDYQRCIQLAGDRFEIFFGRDELLLQSLKAGARSAVGSTYNFGVPLYRKIAAAFAAGDLAQAQALQELATSAIDIMVKAGGLTGIHATMALAGFDHGPMRLPLQALDESQRASLKTALDKLNYFQAIQP